MPDHDGEADSHEGDFLGALAAGTRLQRYELISVLGHGQFGITYLARDTELGREVAIKEYLPIALALRKGGTTVAPRSSGLKADFIWGRERFMEEARTLATLDHVPAVVHAYDFMEANGTAYMVMALVRGETLEERLKRVERLPGPIVERIFARLLDGLEQVHHAGFLHRDIKPANIILDAQDDPTLIDFGAARISLAGRTSAMTAIYTPRYAAVEQEDVAGKLGPWTDIYCLSATLYHAITGQSPPRAITRALNDVYQPLVELAPAGFTRRVLAMIDRGLAFRPGDRPQSIPSWRADDLAAAEDDGNATIVGPRRQTQVASKPLTAAGASVPPVVQPPPRTDAAAARRPPVWYAAIALALILVPGGGYWAFRSGLLPAMIMEAKPGPKAKPMAEAPTAAAQAGHQAETEAWAEAEAKRKAREEGDPQAAEAAATQKAEDEARRKEEQEARAAATTASKGDPPTHAPTDLEAIRARGAVLCGVSFGISGFSTRGSDGKWSGLDVDLCRAVAAAIFGDADKVKFVPTTAAMRFIALLSGDIDLLARATVWTLTRDTALDFDFVGINYYDGQGFLVNKRLGVTSVKQLNGAAICVLPGTTTELDLTEYFRANNMTFKPVIIEKVEDVGAAFFAGSCDVLTYDASSLYSTRAHAPNPDAYVVLPEIISKEPQGLAVRHGHQQFADVVRWTLRAMIAAEEHGIASANLDEMLTSEDPAIRRILGVTPGLGEALGVDDRWVYNIVKQVGNYGESFERNLGQGSPLKIDRGLNNLWTKGGLHYAPPFR
jgi:general L-amino acid transport system substrate-binding protein